MREIINTWEILFGEISLVQFWLVLSTEKIDLCQTVESSGLSDNLPILKKTTVKVKEDLHLRGSMLPCLGKVFRQSVVVYSAHPLISIVNNDGAILFLACQQNFLVVYSHILL